METPVDKRFYEKGSNLESKAYNNGYNNASKEMAEYQ